MQKKQIGQTLVLPINWNKATARPVINPNPNVKLLTNGIRGSEKYTDFEWCCWDKSDKISFTIDLQKNEILSKFTVGCITNYGMAVHKPKLVQIAVSDDNQNFRQVGEVKLTLEDIFREGPFKDDLSVDMGGVNARYVRVTAEGAGECPEDHVRPGQEARIYFDEVIIE